jgi:hypothetical protein
MTTLLFLLRRRWRVQKWGQFHGGRAFMIRGDPQDIVGGRIAGFVFLYFFHGFF